MSKRQKWIIALMIIAFAAALAFETVAGLTRGHVKANWNQASYFAFALFLALGLYYLYKFKRRAWGAKARSAFRKIGAALGKIFRSVKRNFRRLRGVFPSRPRRLRQYSQEKRRVTRADAGQGGGRLRRRWSGGDTNHDAVRRLYFTFIRRRIKKGFAFRPSDTPNEIHGALRNAPPSDALFSLYNAARYHADSEITERDVERAKADAQQG